MQVFHPPSPVAQNLVRWPVVELRWGSRGPGPPENLAAPAKHVLRRFKGACKRPLKLQDDHRSFIDALLQFASVFCTEIAVEKTF